VFIARPTTIVVAPDLLFGHPANLPTSFDRIVLRL